jgi:hypothetical protein
MEGPSQRHWSLVIGHWSLVIGHWSLWFVAACTFVFHPVVATTQDKPVDKPKELGLAVYKLGERYANDKQAGEAIDKLASHLGETITEPKVTFKRRGVRNAPADALKLFKDDGNPVAVAIVSPPFYFAHKDDLKLTALAEAKRSNKDGEQYTLVGTTVAEKYPAGKRVATTLTGDESWLNKVVLPAPEGAKAVTWIQQDNLFDAGYAIIDEEKGAPDFVLVDRITLEAMQKDADLKSLKQGMQSKMLPQDLVVEVDKRLEGVRDALVKALTGLDQTDKGKKIGELIQSPVFRQPDETRLKKAQEKWAAK